MDLGGSLVHGGYQELDESIALDIIVAVIGDFEGVIEEDVG